MPGGVQSLLKGMSREETVRLVGDVRPGMIVAPSAAERWLNGVLAGTATVDLASSSSRWESRDSRWRSLLERARSGDGAGM